MLFLLEGRRARIFTLAWGKAPAIHLALFPFSLYNYEWIGGRACPDKEE